MARHYDARGDLDSDDEMVLVRQAQEKLDR
jgi:hypothetical protein